jgi:thiol-disulfide isomerase/thioredoxin
VRPLAVAALVVAAAAAGAAAYLAFEHRVPLAVSPPAPPAAESQSLQLAGKIPEIHLADREGKMRTLADWHGKSLIVNFWATWCAPCRREIPLLGSLQEQYGPEGFQVIGIAADYRDKVIAYADEEKIGYPLLIGEQEALDAATAFGVQVVGFPFTVFSDNQGRIIACHVGELTRAVAGVILGAVERVNRGQLSPEGARTEISTEISQLKGKAGAQA